VIAQQQRDRKVLEDCTVGEMQALTSTETYSLSVLSIACISVLLNAWRSDGEPLFASLAISGVAFAFSYALIPWTGDVFMRRGYKGKDFSKRNPIEL
jgi:UDP-N-acetylglucosamine--dolichyl-phosphate N-acetylglucosaminephosphotransferase